MVQQRIPRHVEGAKEPPHLYQNQRHHCPGPNLCPESHLSHQATLRATKVIKSKVCHSGVYICILHFQTRNLSIIMHLPRIASAIMIVFPICWVHYLLSGNTADIDFKDDNSLWANVKVRTRIDWKELEFWVLSLSTISGQFKVYCKGYIYMHN
jgi:hypothetical protein